MKSSNMPSPAYTYATTSTVLPSISVLSSSVTPFYPRSYTGSCAGSNYECTQNSDKTLANEIDPATYQPSVELEVDVTADADNSEFYSHPGYVNLGSEAYAVSWAPNAFYCNDNTWNCAGNWRWGHPAPVDYVYAENESEHSTYLSLHPMSYGGLPNGVEFGSTAKQTSVSRPAATSSNTAAVAVASKTALPVKQNQKEITGIEGNQTTTFQLNGMLGDLKNVIANKSDVINSESKDMLKESTKTSFSTDAKPANQESTNNETCEKLKAKQRKVSESLQTKVSSFQKSNSLKLSNIVEDKISIPAVTCVESPPVELLQDSLMNLKIKDKDFTHTQYTDDFTLDREKVGSTIRPGKNISSGHHFLTKSIFYLSKVLVSSHYSATKSFNHIDIERSIFMLSQCLLQSLGLEKDGWQNEKPSYQESQQNRELSFDSDVDATLNDNGIVDSVLKCLLPFMSTRSDDMPPPSIQEDCSKHQRTEYTDKIYNINSNESKEISMLKKLLLEAKCDLVKLQEEIAYERSESNATVSAYKNLWSETQKELDACKSEMVKLRADIETLKNSSKKLRHTGGSIGPIARDMNEKLTGNYEDPLPRRDYYQNFPDDANNPVHNFMAQFLNKKPASEDDLCFSRNSGKGLPESSGYCTDTNAVDADAMCTTNQDVDDHGIINSSSDLEDSASNLENGVAERLSVLLARRQFDLNVACTDTDAKTNDDVHFDYSTMLCEESEMKRSSSHIQETFFQGNTWNATNANNVQLQDSWLRHGETVKQDLGRRNVLEKSSKVWQEDETEIICLRPNDSDNNVTLGGEAEWEHVDVNKSSFS